jgi:Protein of unknown function (DUF2442)
MAKVKMGRWEYTEQEMEKMFDEATIRGKLASTTEPQAKSVHYDRGTNRVIVDLKNGATFIFPCELAEGLRDASAVDLNRVVLGPRGASLHWEKLDVDFSITGLMSGIFGTKAWMARLQRKGDSGKTKPRHSRSAGKEANPSPDVKRTPGRSKHAKGLHSGRAQKHT